MSDENNVPSTGADAGASVLETAETTNAETAVAEANAEQAEADASGEDGESEEQERQRKKSGSARLRERLDREIAEAAVLRERLRVYEESQRAKPVEAAVPKEEDFNGDFFAYQRALARHEARLELLPEIEAVKRSISQRSAEENQAVIAKEFNQREADFKKTVTDYDDVISDAVADGMQLPPHLIDTIAMSERGPALAYWLAKNPSQASKIASMSPLLAAKELGRIEEKISPAKPRTESKAPAPIKPVTARASSPKDLSSIAATGSYEEYRAARMRG